MKLSSIALSVSTACFAIGFSSFSAVAEEPIETLVVTANGYEQPIDQVLSQVSVISREQIEQSPAQDLAGLLVSLPGVQITQSGGFGQNVGVFIRGGNTNQTLILIDGVRVGSATLGYKSLANVSLNQIERVEVLRGPRAAVYGSDAIAGVIQIFTRQGSSPVSVEVTAGSQQYARANVNVGIQESDYYVRATLSHESTDGYNVRNGINDDDDGYRNNTLALSAGWESEALGDFQVNAAMTDSHTQYDSSSSDDVVDSNTHHYALQWQKAFAGVTHQVRLSQTRDKDANQAFGGSPYVYITDRDQFDYLARLDIDDALQFSGGFNWVQDDIGDSASDLVSFNQYKRINRAIFAAAQYQQGSVLLNANVRRDEQSQFGNETTYALAAGFTLSEQWQLTLSHGTGFRAPTFNDLYSPFGGNVNLVPETSKQSEVSLRGQFSNVTLKTTAFQNDVENLIVWTPDDPQGWVWTPKNLQETRNQGVEIEVSGNWWGWQQALNFTLLDTENVLTGAPLPQRAEQSAFWQINRSWDEWFVQLEMEYRGDRQTGIIGQELPSYVVWRLATTYDINDELQINAKLTNVFDKAYESVPSYIAPERQFYIGVTYRL